MKNLIFIILGCCAGIATMAQSQQVLDSLSTIEGKWNIDNNNNVYVQKVIEYEAKTKEQLHFLLKKHLIYDVNANYVIQLDDKENGIIIAKGSYIGNPKNLIETPVSTKYTFWHIIKCEIKENRIRITVVLTNVDVYSPGGGSVSDGFGGSISGPTTDEYHITDFYPINTVSTYTVVTTIGKSVSTKTVNANSAIKNKMFTNQGYLYLHAVNRALNTIEAIQLHVKDSDNEIDEDW